MKLFLIAPKWPGNSLWGQIYFRFPYLALTSIAALTGDGWEVSILDENVEQIDFSVLPDLVAISLMTPLAKRGYEIADLYRQKGVPVVLGGIHPTMMSTEAKHHANAVVIGEAEEIWSKLLEDFKEERLKSLYKRERVCSLNGLPTPKRELLNRKAYFFVNTIQTTRGCPFNCDFCSVTSFFGQSYRTRPVEEVIKEINQMEPGFLFFVDDNIAGSPVYAKRLFRSLIPLNIKWFSQASLSIARDRELLDLAQRSGCKGLFIGFESLSQESIKAMGKSVNRVAEYKEAIKKIHDHGIGIQGSFIFGTHDDDGSVFSDVLRFIERTRLEAVIFSILTPFPGTRVYQTMMKENRIIDTAWENYDMNHVVYKPKKMTPKQLQEGFNWSYKKLYGYRSILKRMFPFRRSGLFFSIQNYGFKKAWEKTFQALLIIICLSLFPVHGFSSEADHESTSELIRVIKNIKEKEKTLKTVIARFFQIKKSRLLRETLKSEGLIYVDFSGKILIKVIHPSLLTLLLKDNMQVLYYPDSGKAEQKLLGRTDNILSEYLGIGQPIEMIRKQFDITLGDKISSEGYHLKIIPKNKAAARHVDMIEVIVNRKNGLPEQIYIKEKQGDHTAIRIEYIAINEPLPPGIFSIESPEDNKNVNEER